MSCNDERQCIQRPIYKQSYDVKAVRFISKRLRSREQRWGKAEGGHVLIIPIWSGHAGRRNWGGVWVMKWGIDSDRTFLPPRSYASAVFAVMACLSVCPSQAGILLKRLNVQKQWHMIAQGL